MTERDRQRARDLLARVREAFDMSEEERLECYGTEGMDLILDRIEEIVDAIPASD